MTVHSLRASMPLLEAQMKDQVDSFTPEFNDASVAAATNKVGKEREEDRRSLCKRKDLRLAHPSLEHFLYVSGQLATIRANPLSKPLNSER
jgi:hypothetical protein